jgi:hypothetical protein
MKLGILAVSVAVGALLSACSSGQSSSSGGDGGGDVAPGDGSKGDAAFDSGPPLGRANGTIGAWQSLTSMPLPRANHCSVAANGYLVVIGGNYAPEAGTFVDIDAIDVARLNADGSLGAWSQAGTTPSPVIECTVAASGDTLYLVDGLYDDMADQGHAFSATLSADGKLSAWKALGPLPSGQDAFGSNAWVASGSSATLYAVDSTLSLTAVLAADTAPAFGTWSVEPWLTGFLGRPEYAFTGSFLYAIGGYLSVDGGNPASTAVFGAPIDADGKVGAMFETQAIGMPIMFGEAVAVDGWIFVVGGKSSLFGSGEANTLSSAIGADGKLGAWKAQTPLPQGRTDMALTLAGDYIYLTGGGYMGPGLATVYAAKVRF